MALTKYNYNSFDVTPVASKALAFNSDADGLTTAAEGSMVLIKTLTASSDSTLSFVDGASDVVLDNTYPIYLFKYIACHPSGSGDTGAQFSFNLSVDTGSDYNVTKTTTSFNADHAEGGSGPSLQYDTYSDLAQGTGFQVLSDNFDSLGNDYNISGYIWLFNPSSTTFVKHFMSTGNSINSNILFNIYVAGYGNTTSAVDAVQFKFSAGNIDAGKIKLYGLKDSA